MQLETYIIDVQIFAGQFGEKVPFRELHTSRLYDVCMVRFPFLFDGELRLDEERDMYFDRRHHGSWEVEQGNTDVRVCFQQTRSKGAASSSDVAHRLNILPRIH
jgi:hypothetical protein